MRLSSLLPHRRIQHALKVRARKQHTHAHTKVVLYKIKAIGTPPLSLQQSRHKLRSPLLDVLPVATLALIGRHVRHAHTILPCYIKKDEIYIFFFFYTTNLKLRKISSPNFNDLLTQGENQIECERLFSLTTLNYSRSITY